MSKWVGLALVLFWAGSAGALKIRCPESMWYGNAASVRDCPCCEVCHDGSFIIKGKGECPTAVKPMDQSASKPVTQTVYEAAKSIRSQLAQRVPNDSTSDLSTDIATFCRRKWETDHSMQQNCQKKQKDAQAEVSLYAGLPEGAEGDERVRIVGRCMDEWTKGGLIDWAMTKDCSEKQNRAYESLR